MHFLSDDSFFFFFNFQAHQHALQTRVKKIKKLQRKAAKKAEQNAKIEQRLPDMHVTVAELRNIYDATGIRISAVMTHNADFKTCSV